MISNEIYRAKKKNHHSCSMIISSPLGILLSPLVRFTRHFTRIRIRYIQESSLWKRGRGEEYSSRYKSTPPTIQTFRVEGKGGSGSVSKAFTCRASRQAGKGWGESFGRKGARDSRVSTRPAVSKLIRRAKGMMKLRAARRGHGTASSPPHKSGWGAYARGEGEGC